MAFKLFFSLLLLVQVILSLKFNKLNEISQSDMEHILKRNCSQLEEIPCPSPIRPRNVLDSVKSNRTAMMRVIMSMYSCVRGNGEQDWFFGLNSFKRASDWPTIVAFNMYKAYKGCPKVCDVYIIYDPIMGIEEHVIEIGSDVIYLECDHRISNCSTFSWNCTKLTEEKDGSKFLAMIEEMLPPRNIAVKSPDRVPSLVFGTIICIGVIIVCLCVLFIKKA